MLGELILKKMKGKELKKVEYKIAISDILLDTDREESKKFLMALHTFGMSSKEVCYMAEAIRDSGYVLNEGVVFEKHSTGGVGDSTSLIIVPLLASLGYKVAKIATKSIRFTNGGRDRFGSIPNFNCELNDKEIHNVLESTNACILSNCKDICPADRMLNALREECGLSEDLNLIAAEIAGKKIASGAKIVLIDVKYGECAFIKTYRAANKLAHLFKRVFNYFKTKSVVIISNTTQTIGDAVGNALEVVDAVEVLQGKKCLLRDVAVEYAAEMILKENKFLCKSDVIEVLESAIDSKLAYNKFLEIVKAQGGDVNVVKNNQIHIPSKSVSFVSQSEGYVGRINTLFLGELVRRLCYFTHDNNIGLKINVKIGDYIKKGDVILTMYNNDLRELDRYKNIIEGCVRITTEKYPATKVIKKVLR